MTILGLYIIIVVVVLVAAVVNINNVANNVAIQIDAICTHQAKLSHRITLF